MYHVYLILCNIDTSNLKVKSREGERGGEGQLVLFTSEQITSLPNVASCDVMRNRVKCASWWLVSPESQEDEGQGRWVVIDFFVSVKH